MASEQLRGLLGLAFRARQLVPGAELGLKLIREGKAGLALIDPVASANTRKKMVDACNHYEVQGILLDAGILGEACGRSGMAAAALRKGQLCDQIRLLAGMNSGGNKHLTILEDKG